MKLRLDHIRGWYIF